jgi:hypothetical protein
MTHIWWFWQWTDERDVQRECEARMDVLDRLPRIVRIAIHESNHYTDPKAARRLVRRIGPERAAHIIMARGAE